MASQQSAAYAILLSLWVLTNIVSSQSNQKTLPQSLINVMASREVRHHHHLWHNVRENWNRLSSSSQRQLRDLGWQPPRPSRRYDYSGNPIVITDNNCGEDFLYMHRQMIAKANKVLADNNESYGRIQGWTTLPAPGDKDWPVPSTYTVPGNSGRTSTIENWKSNSFYTNTIKPMERTLTSPSELRRMTLGEFGSKIEATLHSWYHLRHSTSSPLGYRPTSSPGLPSIDKKWDNPRYNWLVDTYSAQVHPAFWKLHGWVDNRIEDWRNANGLSSIRWKGTWEGGPMSAVSNLWNKKETATSLRPNKNGNEDNTHTKDNVMEKVAEILFKEGRDVSFGDPVFFKSPVIKASKSKRKRCKANLGIKRSLQSAF